MEFGPGEDVEELLSGAELHICFKMHGVENLQEGAKEPVKPNGFTTVDSQAVVVADEEPLHREVGSESEHVGEREIT